MIKKVADASTRAAAELEEAQKEEQGEGGWAAPGRGPRMAPAGVRLRRLLRLACCAVLCFLAAA